MDSGEKSAIDAIITWVDGNDPKHKLKLEKALGGKTRKKIPGADNTRFGNVNELKYSILSIFTFAPFIRKIFIVTDDQDPEVGPYIEKYFPERIGDIRIVDHKEIFKGFEKFLPTFNSRSIEAVLWRIDGLSDNFIYLSDDMFLVREIKPENLFIQNQPVMRGTWLPKPILRNAWNTLRKGVHRHFLKNPDFQPKPSFHVGQWNAAQLLGFKWSYFFSSHTPHAVNKKTVEDFFSRFAGILEKQISYKFRHNEQFNCASFYYHLEIKKGNRNFAEPSFSFLHPYGRKAGYIERKIRKCEEDPKIIFMNIQSLELCNKEEQDKIIGWMEKNLKL
ncbi:Stealth CR1 domain-containing protein [Shivajiella indica]|uniref:Stealth CR1 domain-containing protein n=1 Tax=Shivajiella indica TaxID=872115 RepID=A0ABW5B7I3_9BACT